MKILLLATIFGFVGGQTAPPVPVGSSKTSFSGGLFPDECQEIINVNGTLSEYPVTSIARGFSTFCPIVEEFVDCLEDNLDFLRRSNSSTFRLLADSFNNTMIRDRISNLCSRLHDVAADLECIWNATDIIKPCSIENTELVFKPDLTLGDLCRGMEDISKCFQIAEVTNTCSKEVVDFHRSFIYLFIPPDCQISTYSPRETTEMTTSATIQTPPPVTIIMPTGPSSVIIACGEETYPDILKKIYLELSTAQNLQVTNIFKYIFEAVEDICRGRAKFAACIQERFKPPFMPIDAIIDKLLTDNSIGVALDQYCSLELNQQEEKCLQESSMGMLLCSAMIYSIYGSTQTAVTGNTAVSSSVSVLGSGFNTNAIPPQTGNTDPDYVSVLCPAINVVNQCVGIHLGRCSTTLGQTFINVNKQGFIPECQAAEPTKEILGSPFISVLTMCGIPFGGKIQMEFLSLNKSYNTEQQALDIIRDLIPAGCGYVDFYTTCLSQRLPDSKNLFDRIVKKLFDLTDAYRLQRVFKAVCDETKEIQKHIKCIAEVFKKSLATCINTPEYEAIFKQYQNIYDIDLNTVTAACKPLKEVGLCAANLTSVCNQDFGQLAQDVVLEFLRTECGGARPLSSSSAKIMYGLIITLFSLLVALIEIM